ncbi:MAG: hypothetical protein AAF998_09705 [Bacteroidota bacterium]
MLEMGPDPAIGQKKVAELAQVICPKKHRGKTIYPYPIAVDFSDVTIHPRI